MTRRAIGEGRKRMVISVRQAERERERMPKLGREQRTTYYEHVDHVC